MSETQGAEKVEGPVAAEVVGELERMGVEPGGYDYQPLSVVRRTIARRMAQSFRDIPQFSLVMKIEVDALRQLRERVKERDGAAQVSLNDLLIKAAAQAIEACPQVNVSFVADGVARHRHADIAVAVAIDGGLLTPIVRRAETKSLAQISSEMRDLADRARRKRLMPGEYFGGTFTLSNLGMFGVTSIASILNPPHACILSIGAVERTQRFRGDTPYLADVIHATLTCDHRVLDGAAGAQWLQTFKGLVESPEALAEV